MADGFDAKAAVEQARRDFAEIVLSCDPHAFATELPRERLMYLAMLMESQFGASTMESAPPNSPAGAVFEAVLARGREARHG